MEPPLHSLKLDPASFGFVQREKNAAGKLVKYRCGRDFMYYTLHYYYLEKFNPTQNFPLQIEYSHMFGLRLPWWLTWTQLQFLYLPSLLKKLGLVLYINGRRVNNFFDLFSILITPSKITAEQRIKEVEAAVDNGYVSAIDIALSLGGLVDHVLFVYRYDDNNLYVFDTQQLPMLEYEKLTADDRHIMKLPKAIIKKRWSPFGRMWLIKKVV